MSTCVRAALTPFPGEPDPSQLPGGTSTGDGGKPGGGGDGNGGKRGAA
jgi:hypothetical protein